MPWWPQIGGQPRQGKRQGQAATRPAPSSGKYHACTQANADEKAPAAKEQPTATGLCVIDVFDGRAKPDQYGHRIHRLNCRSARTARRHAFLIPAAFADERLWNFAMTRRSKTDLRAAFTTFATRAAKRPSNVRLAFSLPRQIIETALATSSATKLNKTEFTNQGVL